MIALLCRLPQPREESTYSRSRSRDRERERDLPERIVPRPLMELDRRDLPPVPDKRNHNYPPPKIFRGTSAGGVQRTRILLGYTASADGHPPRVRLGVQSPRGGHSLSSAALPPPPPPLIAPGELHRRRSVDSERERERGRDDRYRQFSTDSNYARNGARRDSPPPPPPTTTTTTTTGRIAGMIGGRARIRNWSRDRDRDRDRERHRERERERDRERDRPLPYERPAYSSSQDRSTWKDPWERRRDGKRSRRSPTSSVSSPSSRC